MPGNIYAKANRQLQRAIARGDLGAAIHWTNIMRDHIGIARTFTDLAGAKPTPKPRRAKSKAETQVPQTLAPQTQAKAEPQGPVMLDPNGFSPGGTPNWFLNQQRLERAGLPLDRAPMPKRIARS
mgnify:CR=1 FL=1